MTDHRQHTTAAAIFPDIQKKRERLKILDRHADKQLQAKQVDGQAFGQRSPQMTGRPSDRQNTNRQT